MSFRCFRAGLSAALWVAVVSSSAAKDLLPSLNPDLSHHSLVEKLCIQGHSMRIYRIGGPIDIERAKQKVASIVPVGSVSDIESDYLLAQWGDANESKLIGLWSVAPSQVEGVYSVLSNGNSRRSALEKLDCFANDPPPRSTIAWMNSGLGLLNLFSIVDYSLEKPTHIAMYSSWLGASALADAVDAALKKNGWTLSLNHSGVAAATFSRTIRASKENARLDLNILSVQGTSVMHMIAQQGE
ncbi:MAG: hypothetical protein ACKO0Z_20655 [Betaproteobacteria bacterium]